ncbi:hypothetical protein ABTX15_17935 [Micromonospora sp. NPDC094482]|uniref:hypothetical protein n=1 Tax=unclassified Micromonospora TaxID=2617518 RepID=UPI00331E77B0
MLEHEEVEVQHTPASRKLVRPSGMLRRIVLASALAIASFLGSIALPATAHASTRGYNLWNCTVAGESGTCTTIVGTSPAGVKVYDHITRTVVTWYDGTSVQLGTWSWDTSKQCGTYGDQYVWKVWWYSNNSWHWAYIGDIWLATGDSDYWRNWPSPWGPLWGFEEGDGFGSGYCNNYVV